MLSLLASVSFSTCSALFNCLEIICWCRKSKQGSWSLVCCLNLAQSRLVLHLPASRACYIKSCSLSVSLDQTMPLNLLSKQLFMQISSVWKSRPGETGLKLTPQSCKLLGKNTVFPPFLSHAQCWHERFIPLSDSYCLCLLFLIFLLHFVLEQTPKKKNKKNKALLITYSWSAAPMCFLRMSR